MHHAAINLSRPSTWHCRWSMEIWVSLDYSQLVIKTTNLVIEFFLPKRTMSYTSHAHILYIISAGATCRVLRSFGPPASTKVVEISSLMQHSLADQDIAGDCGWKWQTGMTIWSKSLMPSNKIHIEGPLHVGMFWKWWEHCMHTKEIGSCQSFISLSKPPWLGFKTRKDIYGSKALALSDMIVLNHVESNTVLQCRKQTSISMLWWQKCLVPNPTHSSWLRTFPGFLANRRRGHAIRSFCKAAAEPSQDQIGRAEVSSQTWLVDTSTEGWSVNSS